ncbi:transmembrane protein 138-like [Atheta coriaria]|uniref:transmembrane protein 138-like n=1 Tax=Dalotia coriaria TaxID=877792 RepID=UPI0031F37137
MKISLQKFRVIFTIQTLLFCLDIALNTFSLCYKRQHAIILILFIAQDLSLIFALALLLLTFFSTYVFQAGLIELLYDRFRVAICICVLYFILTTIQYIWLLIVQSQEDVRIWSVGFTIMFVIHRLASPFYYYSYKRAAMRICDPRYYDDSIWEQNVAIK